jgi:4-amino-4-deoxy-L-arabinose transferase-like glycosyltransferase
MIGEAAARIVATARQPLKWLHSEATVIAGMALAVLALHLATNGLYDFHRDSLYYMDSAGHPAWGYVDYPPVTPTIARLSLWLFGPSVWGLRLWPSIGGAVMVALAALIAREFGGGRPARILAALGAATSLVLLGANWLFQTVTFDQVIWLVCFWLYYYWRPASLDGPVIVVGQDESLLSTLFGSCIQVGLVSNTYGLHNEEYGSPLMVCRQPRMPLDELWPRLKAFR